jgi:hypothetical protein
MKKGIKVVMAVVLIALMPGACLADDHCAVFSRMANEFMSCHQAGVPLEKMMEIATNDIAKEMVLLAYSFPRYQTPEIQQQTISEFRDRAYLACSKNMRKRKR